ncbi:MAG: hypothetical protein KJ709_00045 [Nanoarchaeota archaeon]|nr:hypothetical protein [Nanoarchaeota archaeon]
MGEKSSWDELYQNRAAVLKEVYDSSSTARKSEILGGMEELAKKGPNDTRKEPREIKTTPLAREPSDKGYMNADDYLERLDEETVRGIRMIFTEPEFQQVERIISKHRKKDIADETGVSLCTVSGYFIGMKNGADYDRHTLAKAVLAHWLLNQGYRA